MTLVVKHLPWSFSLIGNDFNGYIVHHNSNNSRRIDEARKAQIKLAHEIRFLNFDQQFVTWQFDALAGI